jgi:hypothetical protein
MEIEEILTDAKHTVDQFLQTNPDGTIIIR